MKKKRTSFTAFYLVNKLFLLILLSIWIESPAMTKISYSNEKTYAELVNADIWEKIIEQILPITTGDNQFLNEISRHIELSSNAYDKIVNSFIWKELSFFPSQDEIVDIVKNNFWTTNSKSLSPEIFRRNIYKAFKRHIEKLPFHQLKAYLDNPDSQRFERNLTDFLNVNFRQYRELATNNNDVRLTHFDNGNPLEYARLLLMLKNLSKKSMNYVVRGKFKKTIVINCSTFLVCFLLYGLIIDSLMTKNLSNNNNESYIFIYYTLTAIKLLFIAGISGLSDLVFWNLISALFKTFSWTQWRNLSDLTDTLILLESHCDSELALLRRELY